MGWTCQVREYVMIALISMGLTIVNILSIYVAGVWLFIFKEVAPVSWFVRSMHPQFHPRWLLSFVACFLLCVLCMYVCIDGTQPTGRSSGLGMPIKIGVPATGTHMISFFFSSQEGHRVWFSFLQIHTS